MKNFFITRKRFYVVCDCVCIFVREFCIYIWGEKSKYVLRSKFIQGVKILIYYFIISELSVYLYLFI